MIIILYDIVMFSIIVKIINTHKKYNIPSNSYISQNHMYIGISLYIFLFTLLSVLYCLSSVLYYIIIIITIIILLILWYYDIILYYYIISQSLSLSYYHYQHQHINNIYHHTNILNNILNNTYILYFHIYLYNQYYQYFSHLNIFTTFIIYLIYHHYHLYYNIITTISIL